MELTSQPTLAKKCRIWPQTHRSKNVTWKAQVGKRNDGKPDIRSFATENEARAFQADWNMRVLTGDTTGLNDLSAVARTEILAALAKLKAFNANITEAVDFFIKHSKPACGQIAIKEAVEKFIRAKEGLKRRPAYLIGCKKTFFLPFSRAFPNKLLNEITKGEAEEYINRKKRWSSSTKASHIQYLTTFYNFHIKKGYATLNPFRDIEKPKANSTKPKILETKTVEALLEFALNGFKPECSIMTLVFFCGVS
jgi:hypothetical protein